MVKKVVYDNFLQKAKVTVCTATEWRMLLKKWYCLTQFALAHDQRPSQYAMTCLNVPRLFLLQITGVVVDSTSGTSCWHAQLANN